MACAECRLYFFDADNEGVTKRVEYVKREIREIFRDETAAAELSHAGAPLNINGYRLGCYIFADDNDNGKLEDIMIPLMVRENEAIFASAGEFLKLKEESRLRRLTIEENNGQLIEKRSRKKMKFDEKKSKICIAGQLQNSGKSNVVIIEDSDYITLKKILGSTHCQNILKFMSSIMATP
ncbi:MAG: hypothetical protein GY862_01155 [Gammaproteobacteria bacterium]|nr:hypothetical protein [Gammaproteobacteria bacterium]